MHAWKGLMNFEAPITFSLWVSPSISLLFWLMHDCVIYLSIYLYMFVVYKCIFVFWNLNGITQILWAGKLLQRRSLSKPVFIGLFTNNDGCTGHRRWNFKEQRRCAHHRRWHTVKQRWWWARHRCWKETQQIRVFGVPDVEMDHNNDGSSRTRRWNGPQQRRVVQHVRRRIIFYNVCCYIGTDVVFWHYKDGSYYDRCRCCRHTTTSGTKTVWGPS